VYVRGDEWVRVSATHSVVTMVLGTDSPSGLNTHRSLLVRPRKEGIPLGWYLCSMRTRRVVQRHDRGVRVIFFWRTRKIAKRQKKREKGIKRGS